METFTMSRKEVPRAGLVKAALAGRITNEQGARALHMTVRQFQRVKKRFREHGARGLLHALRGRPGNRHLTPQAREQITALMTTTYAGFNDVHLTEKLQEVQGLAVSRATVRNLRRALGQPAKRRRGAPKHRSRRPRKAAVGQLAQLDASPFAWFEDRGPAAMLHGLIDDATSEPLALWFRPTEDLHGYVTVLAHTCRAYGLPVELYGDHLNVFQRNDRHWTLAEELQGEQDPTHFGRMLKALGIGFIRAHSPQAKGRIERLWATLQDRLTSELRLRGIHTLEAGNAFLPEFLADYTRRFARPPADSAPAWRPAPRDLDRLLSCRYSRLVARDNTVGLGPRWVQIPPGPRRRSYAGCRATSASSSMGTSSSSTKAPCSPVSRPPGPPSCSSRGRGLERRAAEDGTPARSAPNARQPAPLHHRAPRARPHKALRGPIARGAAISIPPTRRPTLARPARRQPVFSHPRTPGSNPFHVANAP